MYLLANLAVGGDWPGNPDASTVFPGYMDIDYIRAYQKSADVSYPFHTLLPSIEKLATGTYY
jgi:beta-glucanase (GH16 family)